MKKNFLSKIPKLLTILIVIIIVTPILLGLILGLDRNIHTRLWEASIKKPQIDLAKELGVRIEDYPNPSSFPTGYFNFVLKPGMSYREVHAIVKGYKEVYNCWGSDEYYFFFFNDPEKQLIILISYNNQGGFDSLISDTPYDRTLGLDDSCSAGLLGKP